MNKVYTYDANGNMITDQNKGITAITYNHLNLPLKVTFGTTGNIAYTYDAMGVKLKKVVTQGATVTTTNYLSGFQYTQNGSASAVELQFFPHAEGYVKHTLVSGLSKYNYVYNYTDHLGNVRVSYTKDPIFGTLKILEENHNYPFGLKHAYSSTDYEFTASGASVILSQVTENKYNYQYQGQERQDELNLNWDSFKYRNYDYAIGRFMSIDPLAEKYAYNGTYNFSENRVIDGRELEGLEVKLLNPNKKTSTTEQREKDQRIVSGFQKMKNSSTLITVLGHGNPNLMINEFRNADVESGKQLDGVLNRNSEDWKNKESGEGMTVVLYSCRTGASEKDKEGNVIDTSLAQKISASDEFKDVEIVAPDQRVYFSEDGLVGSYEAKNTGKDDEYTSDDHSRTDTLGNWNVFKNGKLIRSYDGNWKPTNNPSLWDKLTKEN